MFGAGWALSTECSQADSSQGHLASTCGLQLSDEWPLWARAPIQQVLDGWAAHAEWSDRWRGTVTPQPVWLNCSLHESFDSASAAAGAVLLVGTDGDWVAAFGGNPRGPAILQLAGWSPCDLLDG